MFGFESPTEHLWNERHGTDDESSWAVWIFAVSADAALAWGQQIAEEFVRQLFEQAGVAPRSWTTDGFAHLDQRGEVPTRGRAARVYDTNRCDW